MPATTAQKLAISGAFAREVFGRQKKTATVHSGDLSAAAEAAYNWAEANLAAYNSALPEPFKSAVTTRQKAELLIASVRELAKVS